MARIPSFCILISVVLSGSLEAGVQDSSTKSFLGEQERLLGLDLSDADVATYEIRVPAGYGVQVTITPDNVDIAPNPPGTTPTPSGPDGTVGCVAVPGVLPGGWAPSPFGPCEPDVEKRALHHEPIQRLVFSTNGEGAGTVNAVNFPDPWDPERHGVFALHCEYTGTAVLSAGDLFYYSEFTCTLLEHGIGLWEYDEWTSHVGTQETDLIDPTQFYSMAVWE